MAHLIWGTVAQEGLPQELPQIVFPKLGGNKSAVTVNHCLSVTVRPYPEGVGPLRGFPSGPGTRPMYTALGSNLPCLTLSTSPWVIFRRVVLVIVTSEEGAHATVEEDAREPDVADAEPDATAAPSST